MSTLALLIALARQPKDDLSKFPTHEQVKEIHQLAQDHYWAAVYRANTAPSHLREVYWEEVKEREILCGYWKLLYDVRNWGFFQTSGVSALKAALHPADFAEGRMPPPIPIWRYRYTD